MPDPSLLLAELAEEFSTRVRQGQLPAVEEYAARHPELAERIRALFPTLMLLEGMAAGGPTAHQRSEAGLRPSSLFGAYRIEREIGRGGMGIVYEAVHLTLNRRVALKVLPTEGLSQTKHLERFLREAQTAAGLHHTNIVPVFDVGQAGGTTYYAMQLIHGMGLDRLGDQGGFGAALPSPPAHLPLEEAEGFDSARTTAEGLPVPTQAANANQASPFPVRRDHYRWVAEVGVQVAEGLAYAHQRGVIHRDIKPANLLLDDESVVWITDFGLARRLEGVALTQSGTILGTPRYMSPEQAEAAKRPIDHRTDIYSLGATLYEILTRRPAFDGKTPQEVVMQILDREPVPPRTLDAKTPADLETIVLKAMAKRPQERYPTGQELADDLRRFLNSEPIKARRISLWGRLVRWTRRHPTTAALVAVCVLSGVGMLALAVGMWQNAEKRAEAVQDLAVAQRDLKAVHQERAQVQAAADEIQEQVQDFHARQHFEQARALARSTEPGRRGRILDLLKKAADLHQRPRRFAPAKMGNRPALPEMAELRSEAAAALLKPDARIINKIPIQSFTGSALTPDGRIGADVWITNGENAGIRVLDLNSGKELASLRDPDMVLSFALSKDGKYAACSVAEKKVPKSVPWQIKILKVGGEGPVRILNAPKEAARLTIPHIDLTFSPDGRFLAATAFSADAPQAEYVLWDLHSGEAVFLDRAPAPAKSAWAVFSRDSNRLAFALGEKKVVVWDLANKKNHCSSICR